MNSSDGAVSEHAGLALPSNIKITCICGQHNPEDVTDYIPSSGRSANGELMYQCEKIIGNLRALKDEPAIQEWNLWRIIENRFPYDMIFSVHHMLVPIREVPGHEYLNDEELTELYAIKMEVQSKYDLIFENFPKRRSILAHYHLHLATWHIKRTDFRL
jgi:hypothetical protein